MASRGTRSDGSDAPGWAQELVASTQDVRVRDLEATLSLERKRHEEETAQLRADITAYRAQLARRDNALAALSRDVTARDEILAARDRLLAQQAGDAAVQRKDAEGQALNARRLQERFNLMEAQLARAHSDSLAAEASRRQQIAALVSQVESLQYNFQVQERQMKLMQQELTQEHQRSCSAVSNAAKIEEALCQELRDARGELAECKAQLRSASTEMQAERRASSQRERQLEDQLRLLQSWLFRVWYSLDAGAEAVDFRRRQNTEVVVKEDWQRTLRLQAQVFHWLVAESVRQKQERLQQDMQQLEKERRALQDARGQHSERERKAVLDFIQGMEQRASPLSRSP